jgi:hypothetical protein
VPTYGRQPKIPVFYFNRGSAMVAATSIVNGSAVVAFGGLTYLFGASIAPEPGATGILTSGAPGAFAGSDPTPAPASPTPSPS